MGESKIGRQIGRLDLLHAIKKGLMLTGAAPEMIEKYMKVVYIANPSSDPVNVQSEPAFAKLHRAIVFGNTAGAVTMTHTVTTGYKWLIRKIEVAASNGTTNVDVLRVRIDGNLLADPFTHNPATFDRIAPSTKFVYVGTALADSEHGFTVADRRFAEQAWATRTIEVDVTNGGDNFYFMTIWYEQFKLLVDESAASDY